MSVFVGVMSGTSLDGIDVAVVRFAGDAERPDSMDLLGFLSEPYEDAFRERIRSLIDEGHVADVCALDHELGGRIGSAVEEALASSGVPAAEVSAIGSHGQTVWHVPPRDGASGSTLQVGAPAVIAEVAGIDVVSDFRSRDVAAGGHGAPLTAYTDRVMFTADHPRLIQNIGGMANVTALPPTGSRETPLAFDTGPGVALIDAAVRRLTDQPFDEDGRLAAAGTVVDAALEDWLDDPFFVEPPPRSTGRELFSTARLESWLARFDGMSVEDTVATLTELTARTIADAYGYLPEGGDCFLCGGGARNLALVSRLRRLVEGRAVRDLSDLGMDPEAREAIAFALLARQNLLGFRANAPWATGASGRRLLGSVTKA